MNIVFASSEVYPFAKTGGLGDVVGTLPKAIRQLGHEVIVFLPNYAQIEHSKYFINYVHEVGGMPIRVDGRTHWVHLHMAHLPGSDVKCYFVDYPEYFHKDQIYIGGNEEDVRFILFSKAVIESLQRLQFKPDIIHCNDWQTGLIPLYIKDNYSWDKMFEKTATVITIHNIGYQGRFPKETMFKAEISEDLFYENSPIEVWNGICFLKAGLMYADALNTVSPTYANETMTSEYGEGLEGVLQYRKKDYVGILNGVDYSVWNPENDKYIPFHYSVKDMKGKEEIKKYLLGRCDLPYDKNVPLIGIVSRLVPQKGFDILAEALPSLMGLDAQWVILGTGETHYENMFKHLAYSYPQKVYSHIGYNNAFSHIIEAGADMFLMPSKYEPCGLNQIYSLKYGTVPLVRKTGGLADTVLDWDDRCHKGKEDGTGFSFNDYSGYALHKSVERAVNTYKNSPKAWKKIQQNGMKTNYSWETSAKEYLALYKKASKNRNAK